MIVTGFTRPSSQLPRQREHSRGGPPGGLETTVELFRRFGRLAEARYASPLAEELAEDVLARFLGYVVIDTQSDPTSSYPSTEKQLDLSRLLLESSAGSGSRTSS